MKKIQRELKNLFQGSPGSYRYRHDKVLRRYAGVILPHVIEGSLQHGWRSDSGVTEPERAVHFVWNRSNFQKAREEGLQNVTPIGAPFLYLPPLKRGGRVHERGLIAMPAHGWEKASILDPVRTYDEYASRLEELKRFYNPVTVCLYWIEYRNREITALFERRGISVVTVGHSSRKDFLEAWRRTVEPYAYVTSNEICTSVFYGLHMGKRVFLYGTPMKRCNNDSVYLNNLSRRFAAVTEAYGKKYPVLLRENFDDRPHPEIAAEELGLEFRQSPAALRRLMKWSPRDFICRAASRCLPAAKSLADFLRRQAARKLRPLSFPAEPPRSFAP